MISVSSCTKKVNTDLMFSTFKQIVRVFGNKPKHWQILVEAFRMGWRIRFALCLLPCLPSSSLFPWGLGEHERLAMAILSFAILHLLGILVFGSLQMFALSYIFFFFLTSRLLRLCIQFINNLYTGNSPFWGVAGLWMSANVRSPVTTTTIKI